MKSKWNNKWNRSIQPRKQRKYIYNAPLSTRKKFVSAHMSKELREKYRKRNIGLRKGDKVKIMRGQFKDLTGKVEKVNLRKLKIYVENIKIEKNDGTMSLYPLSPSNLMIIELNLDDKKRIKALKRKPEKKQNKAKKEIKTEKKIKSEKKKLVSNKKSSKKPKEDKK